MERNRWKAREQENSVDIAIQMNALPTDIYAKQINCLGFYVWPVFDMYFQNFDNNNSRLHKKPIDTCGCFVFKSIMRTQSMANPIFLLFFSRCFFCFQCRDIRRENPTIGFCYFKIKWKQQNNWNIDEHFLCKFVFVHCISSIAYTFMILRSPKQFWLFLFWFHKWIKNSKYFIVCLLVWLFSGDDQHI